MEKNTLGEIIAAERRIRERLEEERRKAEQHLQNVREQARREAEEAERRHRASCDRAIREAEAAAREKAESIRRTAREQDRRLRSLDAAALKRLVLRHMAVILPEAP